MIALVAAILLAAVQADEKSPLDDAAFCKRVTRDLIGVDPTDEELRAFLADPDRSKRVDDLLQTDAFARLWGTWLAEVFIGTPADYRIEGIPGLDPKAPRRIADRFVAWMVDNVRNDRPYDAIVREMVGATGRTDRVPALGYKLGFHRDRGFADEFTSGSTRRLLGVRISCAGCHDHPYASFTETHYDNLKNFVIHLRARAAADGEEIQLDEKMPEDPPRAVYLYGGSPGKGDSPIAVLAGFITAKANLQLPMALVNRVWERLMGRPIVEPVDGFDPLNISRARKLFNTSMKRHTLSFRKDLSIRRLVGDVVLCNLYGREPEPPRYRLADVAGPRYQPAPTGTKKPTLDLFTLPKGWPIMVSKDTTYVRCLVPAKEGFSAEFVARMADDAGSVFRRKAWVRRLGKNGKVNPVALEGAPKADAVEMEGGFSCDMRTDSVPRPWRVLLSRVERPEGTWNLILTGPAETVAVHREAFLGIVRSIGR